MICTDFADFWRMSLCIIKDRFSGMLALYVTKDKTAESAIRSICKWMHRYGLQVEVRSDQGPCYSAARFKEWLKSCGIRHCVSSAYNAQSNGAAEKGVQQIKTLLTKLNQSKPNQTSFPLNAKFSAISYPMFIKIAMVICLTL